MRDSGPITNTDEVKILAQLQPSTTAAQTLYTPPSGKKALLTHLWIAVYDNDVITNIFHDEDGTTFDDTTAWMREIKILKDVNIVSLPLGDIRVENGGAIGIQIDKTSDATFSLYGKEEDV